ncbi:hypothetical protein EDC96DRAFT_225777 [Choanephora cucurbitarum]|nr:hypothetical protein EDC96DRAFT_225777 [Choanephora cucurbitarum]
MMYQVCLVFCNNHFFILNKGSEIRLVEKSYQVTIARIASAGTICLEFRVLFIIAVSKIIDILVCLESFTSLASTTSNWRFYWLTYILLALRLLSSGLSGLSWLGLNWLGLNWLGLNWLGLNWLAFNLVAFTLLLPDTTYKRVG